MEDLSQALVFHRMRQDPEHLRALLKRGGPEAVWSWAEKVEEDFLQAHRGKGLDGRDVEVEFFRIWTPAPEEDDPKPEHPLSIAELHRIMSATENLMPQGLYADLTQAYGLSHTTSEAYARTNLHERCMDSITPEAQRHPLEIPIAMFELKGTAAATIQVQAEQQGKKLDNGWILFAQQDHHLKLVSPDFKTVVFGPLLETGMPKAQEIRERSRMKAWADANPVGSAPAPKAEAKPAPSRKPRPSSRLQTPEEIEAEGKKSPAVQALEDKARMEAARAKTLAAFNKLMKIVGDPSKSRSLLDEEAASAALELVVALSEERVVRFQDSVKWMIEKTGGYLHPPRTRLRGSVTTHPGG